MLLVHLYCHLWVIICTRLKRETRGSPRYIRKSRSCDPALCSPLTSSSPPYRAHRDGTASVSQRGWSCGTHDRLRYRFQPTACRLLLRSWPRPIRRIPTRRMTSMCLCHRIRTALTPSIWRWTELTLTRLLRHIIPFHIFSFAHLWWFAANVIMKL